MESALFVASWLNLASASVLVTGCIHLAAGVLMLRSACVMASIRTIRSVGSLPTTVMVALLLYATYLTVRLSGRFLLGKEMAQFGRGQDGIPGGQFGDNHLFWFLAILAAVLGFILLLVVCVWPLRAVDNDDSRDVLPELKFKGQTLGGWALLMVLVLAGASFLVFGSEPGTPTSFSQRALRGSVEMLSTIGWLVWLFCSVIFMWKARDLASAFAGGIASLAMCHSQVVEQFSRYPRYADIVYLTPAWLAAAALVLWVVWFFWQHQELARFGAVTTDEGLRQMDLASMVRHLRAFVGGCRRSPQVPAWLHRSSDSSRRIRIIGECLQEQGGRQWMATAAESAFHEDSREYRLLDKLWDGIGQWRAGDRDALVREIVESLYEGSAHAGESMKNMMALSLAGVSYMELQDWSRRIQSEKAHGLRGEPLKQFIRKLISTCTDKANAERPDLASEEAAIFKFSCPHCAQRIAAEISRIGEQSNCPTCSGNFIVPAPETELESATQRSVNMGAPPMVSKPEASNTYLEKDNLGSRQDSLAKAEAYWMHERLNSQRKDPFALYTFPTAQAARAALLELPCIHVAADTQRLICTLPLHFGHYEVEPGRHEALICGDDLPRELWQQAREVFTRHGGRVKTEKEPEKSAAQISGTQGSAANVRFLRDERQPGQGGIAIYRIHTAPSKADAMAFLQTQQVTRNLLYLVVETPEGNYCRDIGGIYKEDA